MIPALSSALDCLRPAFSRERSFRLVTALLMGMIFSGKDTTITWMFLHLQELLPGVIARYWSLPKSLARRRWDSTTLITLWLRFLMGQLPDGWLLADLTHTTAQGRKQQDRHYRPNPKYRKGQQNQSKFLAGNSILSLAYVAGESLLSGVRLWVFSLGGVLLKPQKKSSGRRGESEQTLLRRVIVAIAPPGMLVVYDRGGNDATTINTLVQSDLRLITRLNANAVIYEDRECRQKIDTWKYNHKRQHRKQVVYHYEVIAYRHKVKVPLKVVVEISYNRSKRRWKTTYYISTDLSLSAAEIVGYYRSRREIEGTHSDSKLVCGMNSCRVHSSRTIEGYLCLSLLSSGVLEYLRWSLQSSCRGKLKPQERSSSQESAEVSEPMEILKELGMHWYRPMRLTRGITSRWLGHQLRHDAEKLTSFRAYFSPQIPDST